jgi:hypothetical protein
VITKERTTLAGIGVIRHLCRARILLLISGLHLLYEREKFGRHFLYRAQDNQAPRIPGIRYRLATLAQSLSGNCDHILGLAAFPARCVCREQV